ncbi:MAG: hypothetical protein HZB26_06685 [Candidatus Hydrogenedentes bacterium]|nr:hypothetical protein [Candidatus Hydrogenedentota bacterium]
MLATMLLLLCAGAGEDLAPRIAVLQTHLERLHAITVPESLTPEKTAKLNELKTLLDKGANSVEEFNGLYYKIDEVRSWLWKNAVNKPAKASGEFKGTDSDWEIHAPELTLRVSKVDLAMEVTTAKAAWRFQPCDDADVEMGGAKFGLRSAAKQLGESFDTGYSKGLALTLSEFPAAPGFELRLTVNLIGSEIVFEAVAKDTAAELKFLRWPKPIVFGNAAEDLSVIPMMQGMLLPGDWPQEIKRDDLCNSRTLYMPWWGQIHDGHGVQTILETSDDAGVRYAHPSGGPTVIQPWWAGSLGKLRYLRTVRYVFDDQSSYVSMAKRYRRYVQETGRFVSLDEKRQRTPNVNEVIGRPVIHIGALYHFVQQASLFNKDRIEANHQLVAFSALANQLCDLKKKGVGDAYVHLDGWGFYGYDNGHPDVLPPGEEQGGWDGLRAFADTCDELGYLFAVHDQYRDFYLNAASFDDRLVATRQDGSREEHSTWCGGPQTILSARFAPEYVRRNHDLFAKQGVKVRGAYLDVFAVVPLEESSPPAHPMMRTECAMYRRECFDVLRARGYVVSSEEPADYLAPTLDLVHHGPYSTTKEGGPTGIPVPLFSLVYHDSLLLPWDMGEDGGWGIPKGDAGRLHCLLNAGLPYVNAGATEEQIARVKEACSLGARCNTKEMVNHEFLDATHRKQRTTFSDGTRVTVDFDAKTHTIEPGV